MSFTTAGHGTEWERVLSFSDYLSNADTAVLFRLAV